jgi:hypothetical protein
MYAYSFNILSQLNPENKENRGKEREVSTMKNT